LAIYSKLRLDYPQTLQFLYNSLPYFSRDGKVAYKNSLDNIVAFCAHLHNPHHVFKTLHVAGTNGKGSVSHSLAAILQKHGYKTGLYTSPHLIDFRERIRVDGKMCTEEFVVDFVKQHQKFIQSLKPSFFEITVAMAFDYFRQEGVEIAVIEVGLGGRLDSTNIINPELSIITHIAYDHQDLLGNTLAEIGYEKAGIIKPNTPVLIGRKQKETETIFEAKARLENAPLFYAEEIATNNTIKTELQGVHQQENLKTVLAALSVLENKKGYTWKNNLIEEGLLNINKLTGLRGRWEVLRAQNPKIIVDTAHNQEGLEVVLKQILQEYFHQLHIVMGMVNDKDRSKLWKLFPKNAIYYFCKPNLMRGLDAALLQDDASQRGLSGNVYESCEKAYLAALSSANTHDLIYVGGSTFVVAEILTLLENERK
jgi:dihydrofolate synthase/folylpolyglutamate synthase